MNRICRRVMVAAGALALTGGTALTAAMPASAQINPNNFSYGASVNGYNPLGEAYDSFGSHVVHLGHMSLLNVFSSGNVVDTAFPSGASSNVAGVNVRSILAALGLTARVVRTSCDTNGNTQTTILGGLVGVGGFGQPVDTQPYQDERIDLPGGVTVLLNHPMSDWYSGDDGVAGLFIELPSGTDIPVAVSFCENNT